MATFTTRWRRLAAGAFVGACAANAAGQPWDVSTQFSTTENPHGAWSYGTRAQAGGTALSLLPDALAYPGSAGRLLGWIDEAHQTLVTPVVIKNITENTVRVGTFTVPALSVAMHPGPVGFGPGGSREFVAARWTAPVEMGVRVEGAFAAGDTGTTRGYVVHNGSVLFEGVCAGAQAAVFDLAVQVGVGDVLDFVVGNNGNFRFDTVVLRAAIGERCAADWNRDGVVNSTDVSDFINDWFEDLAHGTLVTDWDGNGVVNSTDVSLFINEWLGNSLSVCA